GSKANGDRKSIRTHVTRPKGAYGYTLSKLKALAQDWEADMVEETEFHLTKIRHEASHLVKAIICIRHARSAADRV
ncbi:MAG: conjugative transfer protein MobI(A/C), partial [Sterolibacterium sp.]